MELITGKTLDFFFRLRTALSLRLGALSLLFFKSTGRVTAGDCVIFKGIPHIDVRRGSHIHIGAGVTLNSSPLGYHLNMFSPVKLMVDRNDATIKIGDGTRIHGFCIHAKESISIGARCLIAANCQIMDNNGHDLAADDPSTRIGTTGLIKPVVIDDDVWLGTGVVVLAGVRIGRGSVVGAGSVVTADIPPMVLAGGAPSMVLRQLTER